MNFRKKSPILMRKLLIIHLTHWYKYIMNLDIQKIFIIELAFSLEKIFQGDHLAHHKKYLI